MVRWNITIPEVTDRTVRAFLRRNGGKKGDLSRFVDEAVRSRVFELTIQQVKDRNTGHAQQEILELVNGEVNTVRAGRRT